MKRTYFCTKEEPLHKQISPKESLQIEKLEVKGYLDEEDYELLTEMSGVKGCLKHLDLSGVTESIPGPDDWRFFSLVMKIWQYIQILLSIVSDWRKSCFHTI